MRPPQRALPTVILTTLLLFCCNNLQADISLIIYDDGTNVYMEATGSFDLSQAPSIDGVSVLNDAILDPEFFQAYGWGWIGQGLGFEADYSGFLSGSSFAEISNLVLAEGSPIFFVNDGNNTGIHLPPGSPAIGSVDSLAIWENTTLSSLGMVAGEKVTVTWQGDGGDNSATISVLAGPPGMPPLGDANDDGAFNNLDIAAFVLALTNSKAYSAMFPDVDPDVVLDMNGDGGFDNLDIAGFVAALTGGGTK